MEAAVEDDLMIAEREAVGIGANFVLVGETLKKGHEWAPGGKSAEGYPEGTVPPSGKPFIGC